ncbi:hypothetical protein PIB30_109814, partial [Stylosanthes scabra]|nr:hypothetical protein [Stylosanthes scabra]
SAKHGSKSLKTHAYAWKSMHMCGKLPHHVLSHILEEVERDPSLASLSRATHMRRTTGICVEGKLLSNSFKATLQREPSAVLGVLAPWSVAHLVH